MNLQEICTVDTLKTLTYCQKKHYTAIVEYADHIKARPHQLLKG